MLGRIIAGGGRQNHDRPASFCPTMPAGPNPTPTPAFPHIPPWLLCAPSEPEQPPKYQGNMRPKNTPVLVGLIHDDISQVRKQPPPQVRVGENPAVEHVRISDQIAAGGPNGAAGLGGGVTVVRRGVDAGQRRVGPTEPQYCGELVVSQGFGGGEVEGAGCRVAGQVGEGGELVAQCFPRRGAGGDNDVAPIVGGGGGEALVLVGAGDAVFVGKLGDEWGICPGGPVAVDCGSGRLGDGGAVGGGHGWSLVAKNQVQPLSIRV